jgi:hypothetical protein
MENVSICDEEVKGQTYALEFRVKAYPRDEDDVHHRRIWAHACPEAQQLPSPTKTKGHTVFPLLALHVRTLPGGIRDPPLVPRQARIVLFGVKPEHAHVVRWWWWAVFDGGWWGSGDDWYIDWCSWMRGD